MPNNRLYERRKELGLTLEQVGNIVGVGKSTVRKWETGYIENMKRDKIELLAKALKTTPLFIMGIPEENTEDNQQEESKDAGFDFKSILEQKSPVMYDGIPISEEDREKVKQMLEILLAGIKKEN